MKSYKSKRAILALIMSLIMVLGLGTSVFANDDPATEEPPVVTNDGKVAVSLNTTPAAGDNFVATAGTFSVYKILEVDQTGKRDGKTYYTYKAVAPFTALESATGLSGYTYNKNGDGKIETANGTEIVDTNLATNSKAYTDTEIAKFATTMSNVTGAEAVGTLPARLDPGYYVIIENPDDPADGYVASKPMLLSVNEDSASEGITINPKNDEVTLEKNITGDNDKSNNVSIGDNVPYTITTKIPTYEANVDKSSLKFVLTDTFSDGLDYNGDIVIAGFDTSDYTVTPTTVDGHTTTLKIEFTQDAIVKNQGKAVTVTYSAKLNAKAKVDSTEGNPNKVELEYTHNPSEGDDSRTLEDKTITYTYGFNIHKVDKVDTSKDLNDAKFEVYTTNEDGTEGAKVNFIDNHDGTYTVTDKAVGSEGTTTEIVSQAKEGEATETGLATVKGLEEGKYILKETQAPDEYTQLADDILVTITAVKENGKETGVAQLTASGAGEATAEGGTPVVDNDGKQTGSVQSDGSTININVLVKNAKGINLPNTGRNTALYCMIGGGALVVLGGLYYAISRRRNNA